MPCYHPLKGYRSKTVNASGKRSLTFNRHEAYIDLPIETACGQCIGCKLERSRQWAIRCVHEASLYEANQFLTLTYSPQHIPKNGSLQKTDFQKFMKRYRKYFEPRTIRYYYCGEYGETTSRPHYHACIFNHKFEDLEYLKSTDQGFKLYTSKLLADLWPLGQCSVGELTFETAAYTARYITKKITGPDARDHYGDRLPEFTNMSTSPGIGSGWFDKYRNDIFPDDFIVLRGQKMKTPKAYSRWLEKNSVDQYQKIKASRKSQALDPKKQAENTVERLQVREDLHYYRLAQLKRSFE